MSASDTSKKIARGPVAHSHRHAGGLVGDRTAGDAIAPVALAEPAPPPAIPGNGGEATVVFDSIGDPVEQSFNPHDGTTAQSFSTGAAGSVTDVELVLHGFLGYQTDGGDIAVELFSDSDTSPGTLIATLGTIADASLPASAQAVDLPVTGAPELTADTRYWIELTASTDNTNWGGTDSDAGTGVSTEFADLEGIITPDGGGPVDPEGGGIRQGGPNDETFLMSVTTTACFAAGSRIRTVRGEVPVESLREGDLVATAGGRLAPVRWIGHRRVVPARHPRPWDVNPVRIRAGALGEDRPARDLLLSPDHAVFLGGVLVRARDLLNGATVVQESVADVTYYHVELDRHDVLFAEGAPAESFLDTGNRAAFDNGGAAAMAHPDFARAVWARDACAPLVWQGPALAAVRGRVADLAWRLGWALTDDPDLHVVAGNRAIRPTARRDALAFDLPGGLAAICLHSRSTVPAYVLHGNIDTRRLGVPVVRLLLDGEPVPLDGAVPGTGWLAPEAGLRWTDGAATLHVDGASRLEIGLAALRLPYWLTPEAADAGLSAMRAA